MKQIDFLPKYYHEQAAKRKSKVWRYTVIALFGSSVLMTAIVQYAWKLETRRHSSQIDTMYAEAQSRRQESERLKVEYTEAQQDAELHTYLKSPWPRTQLLSQITSALSPAVRLGEVRFLREVKETKGPSKEATPPPPIEITPGATHAALVEADLKRLRYENDSLQTVIYIAGVTTDPAAVHAYVAKLCRAPLMSKVELRALDSDAEVRRLSAQAARFVVRIVVRPGYGQPDGPTTAPAKLPKAVPTPTDDTVARVTDGPGTFVEVASDERLTDELRGQP